MSEPGLKQIKQIEQIEGIDEIVNELHGITAGGEENSGTDNKEFQIVKEF